MKKFNYPELAMRTNKPGEELVFRESSLTEAISLMGIIIGITNHLDKLKAELVYERGDRPEALKGAVVNMCPEDKELVHAALGLITEVGAEILPPILKEIQDKIDFGPGGLEVAKLDWSKMNLGEEAGDLSWFMELMAKAGGQSVEDWRVMNIEKLKVRYPDKYSDELANNRDKDAEKSVLETG